jgi:hypothetical protein
MMTVSLQRIYFDVERTGTPGGAFAALGSALDKVPVVLIFDNSSNAAVQVSIDGINTWKTFAASEALVLDLTANQIGVSKGTQFYIKGPATGTFSLASLSSE